MTQRPASPLDAQTRCPRCNSITDAVAQADGVVKKPAVGDIVVCTRCAGALTLTNVGSLRELRDEEFRALPVASLLKLGQMQADVSAGKFRSGLSG